MTRWNSDPAEIVAELQGQSCVRCPWHCESGDHNWCMHPRWDGRPDARPATFPGSPPLRRCTNHPDYKERA